MIRINLLGEKQDNSALYTLQIVGLGGALALVILGCMVFQTTMSSTLTELESEKALQQSRLTKLQRKTKKVDELEKLRKLQKEKLNTIAKLKSKKQGPVRVLADLTEAVPERTWLLSVTQKGEVVEFTGLAMDNQTVSLFMANLEKSDYFHNVDLMRSAQYIRDDVKMQQFSLSAKLTSLLKQKEDPAEVKQAKKRTSSKEKRA